MRYRYRSDDELKDSGVEWIGKIPKDWTISKIKYIKSLENNSFVDGPFGSNLKSEHFIDNGDIYVIESNFATQGVLNTENLKTITLEHFQTIKRSEVKQGDIVLAKIGAQFGLSSILPQIDKRAVISGNTLKLSINLDKVSNEYIHYQLITIKRKGVLDTIVSTTAQPAVSLGDMNNLNMVLPKKYEQEKIANFLDEKTSQFDLIISKKEELIKKLDEAKKSLISEVVTGKVKVVKNDDGYELIKRNSEEMKDSGVEWLGEIPKDWEVSKIKYICDVNKLTLSENTSDEYRIKYIDIGSVNSNGEISNIQEFLFKDSPSRARRIVKYKDIIISTVRTYLKAITSIDKEEDNLICSTGFAVLTPNESISYKFLSYFVRSNSFIDEIVSRSTGVSYPAITSTEISNLQIIIPNNIEQVVIGDYIELKIAYVNGIINKTKQQIEKLKEAKQSLISEAVTGKIEILD